MEPAFLHLGEALEIHRDQVKRYGGSEGIRDMGLLESALAAPQSGVHGRYAHADLFEMAAAHLFHIVKNHPFVDGNKRTGAVAALVFLSFNGVEIAADEMAFEKIVLAVVEGVVDKGEVAKFFRDNSELR